MPRGRTTKKLAQRIELQYFTKPHPLRGWRFRLAIIAPVVAAIWLAWAALAHNRRPYSSGPMSSVHAVFGLDCSACHISQVGQFQLAAADRACLSCHDGPIHHANQTFTPHCADCHLEHQGRIHLALTRDSGCTQCHASLQSKSGPPPFVRVIQGFNAVHPEFRVLRDNYQDPGTIKVNHFVHLKKDLRGPDGKPVQLACSDCHRSAGVQAPWRFAVAGVEPAPLPPAPTPAALKVEQTRKAQSWPPFPFRGQRAYMAPVPYAGACVACHPLLFDKRFTESVPHDKPEIVHAFVVAKFQEYIARHPEELRETAPPALLPGRPLPRPRVLTPNEWVTERVAESEFLLWGKTCKECHSITIPPGAALPTVAPPETIVRYMPHAIFDHQAHQLIACASCHTAATTSRNSTDVLVPSIKVCQECHHTGMEAANNQCSECHVYHDWSKQKPTQSTYSIRQLLRATAPGAGPASVQATGEQ